MRLTTLLATVVVAFGCSDDDGATSTGQGGVPNGAGGSAAAGNAGPSGGGANGGSGATAGDGGEGAAGGAYQRMNLLFSGLFEGDDYLAGFDDFQSCCDYSTTQDDALARSGASSLRFELHRDDETVSGSKRAEVTLAQGFDSGERWYGLSYFYDDYLDDPSAEHTLQWHPDSSTGSAVLGIWTGDNTIMLVHQTSSEGAFEYVELATLPVNAWVDYVLHVNWSSDDDGFVEFWIDPDPEDPGPPDYAYQGPTDFGGQYIKIGINKFCWQDPCNPPSPPSSTTRIFHVDEFRIGDENATLKDVCPSDRY